MVNEKQVSPKACPVEDPDPEFIERVDGSASKGRKEQRSLTQSRKEQGSLTQSRKERKKTIVLSNNTWRLGAFA
jgi:hypothetical protein